MALGKTISLDDYLVKLGFSVDATGLNQFLELLDKGKRGVEKAVPAISSSLTKATLAYVGFISQAAIGIASLVNSVAQMDKELAIQSRKFWMNKSAFTEMSYAAEALGYSMDNLNEIALSPELTRQFYELLDISKKIQPDEKLLDNLKLVREVAVEINKFKMQARYGLYTFGASLAKYLKPEISDIKNDLKEINGELLGNSASIIDGIAKMVAPVVKELKNDLWPIIRGGAQLILKVVKGLSENPEMLKNYMALLKLLLIVLSVFSKNPLGILIVAASYLVKLFARLADNKNGVDKLSQILVKIFNFIGNIGRIAKNLFTVLEPLLNFLVEALTVVFDILSPIFEFVLGIIDSIVKFIGFLGGVDTSKFGGNKYEYQNIVPDNLFNTDREIVNNNSNTKTNNVNITNNNSIYGSNVDANSIGSSIGDYTRLAANRALSY